MNTKDSFKKTFNRILDGIDSHIDELKEKESERKKREQKSK